jgi:hypothetical protein
LLNSSIQCYCCACLQDKNQAETLFKLLLKYRPEDKKEKAERLKAEAEAREAGKVCALLVDGVRFSVCACG